MERKKWKSHNFREAVKYSLAGIEYAFTNERNLRIQLVFAILSILLGRWLKLSSIEFIVLFLTIGLVIFAEMVNTAMEFLFDLYSEEYKEEIKVGKNIASGAVLITSIVSVMVGIILFLPKILNLI